MPIQSIFYEPALSYEDNYHKGPFGLFADSQLPIIPKTDPVYFMNQKVNTPFGIPAGPLLNSRYIEAAFRYGFDVCTYKTVRSKAHKCYPLPNILAVHPSGNLSSNSENVLADYDYSSPLSITNSFGVPSFSPDIWQPDMAKSVEMAGDGQLVIGSFQGSRDCVNIERDYALTAKLVAETKVSVLEANLSCPNEETDQLLCFDIDKVERITSAIKEIIPNKYLIIKLSYFSNDHLLSKLVERVGSIVDGFSAINSLLAKPVNNLGNRALSENRLESGICGDAIRWANLDMVTRLARIRQSSGMNFSIVGVGGISSHEHYQECLSLGADLVMSATASMWNPRLAIDIKAKQAELIPIV